MSSIRFYGEHILSSVRFCANIASLQLTYNVMQSVCPSSSISVQAQFNSSQIYSSDSCAITPARRLSWLSNKISNSTTSTAPEDGIKSRKHNATNLENDLDELAPDHVIHHPIQFGSFCLDQGSSLSCCGTSLELERWDHVIFPQAFQIFRSPCLYGMMKVHHRQRQIRLWFHLAIFLEFLLAMNLRMTQSAQIKPIVSPSSFCMC